MKMEVMDFLALTIWIIIGIVTICQNSEISRVQYTCCWVALIFNLIKLH